MSLNYPTKVVLGDISVRDGLQHEERFIPTRAGNATVC
jgi:hydroxymethylglutaryl-CoA lyase